MRKTIARANRPGRSPAHVAELLRPAAPVAEIEALVDQIGAIRGIHRVDVNEAGDQGHHRLFARGTDRAVNGAANALMLSGLQELDENADHDHAKCLADAAAAGVPANWAHRIETYLSM